MKHLFVPYEIALRLKEKGFDEPCLAFYYGQLNNLEIGFNWLSNEGCRNSLLDEIISAPLYQQVIDWFREKHDKFISISVMILPESKEYRFLCYEFYGAGDRLSKTYYEALKLV